jgi:hypothetical protein
MLASLPPEAEQAITERLREMTGGYETPEGLELPGVSLIAAGRGR